MRSAVKRGRLSIAERGVAASFVNSVETGGNGNAVKGTHSFWSSSSAPSFKTIPKVKCFCMTTKSGSHNRIWPSYPLFIRFHPAFTALSWQYVSLLMWSSELCFLGFCCWSTFPSHCGKFMCETCPHPHLSGWLRHFPAVASRIKVTLRPFDIVITILWFFPPVELSGFAFKIIIINGYIYTLHCLQSAQGSSLSFTFFSPGCCQDHQDSLRLRLLPQLRWYYLFSFPFSCNSQVAAALVAATGCASHNVQDYA